MSSVNIVSRHLKKLVVSQRIGMTRTVPLLILYINKRRQTCIQQCFFLHLRLN